jgi:hypothetical protein
MSWLRRWRTALRRTLPFRGDPVGHLIEGGDGPPSPPPRGGRLFDLDGRPADDAIRAAADPGSDGTSGPAADNALGPATGGTPGPGASKLSA